MNTNKLRFVEDTSTAQTSVAERKKAMRRRMKERRADNENRDVKETLLTENCLALLNSLLQISKLNKGQEQPSCFVYLSFSSEAPTDKLIENLLSAGVRVYCPRVEGKQMQAVAYGEDFSLSAYGIREPLGEPFEGEIDAVIVPLLAVDTQGNRLGYGGGYYDGFLRKHTQAKRIAYCFDFQVETQVPAEEWDEKMQYIVTDKRVLQVEK